MIAWVNLVKSRRDGNRLYHRANKEHPLFSEIHSLVIKTSGLIEVLSIAFADLDILLAFVFGSVARYEITASSDIDPMVFDDFNVNRIAVLPAKTDSPLIIDTNTVLTTPISRESFQAISRWAPQISKCIRHLQDQKPSQSQTMTPFLVFSTEETAEERNRAADL